ncbi:hypothetical protein [Actinoplanes sp. NPDC051851]|uniref:hypothetical protein n=1 Tax=Actinoplanes sp. NPDC051851 TaxID=3154753 RepID=UPI00341956B6
MILDDALKILDRAETAHEWVKLNGYAPPYVREHFNHDVPALVSAVKDLIAANAKLTADLAKPCGTCHPCDNNSELVRLRGIELAATHWLDTDEALDQARYTDDGFTFGRASAAYADAGNNLAATIRDTTNAICIHCGRTRRRADLRLSAPIGQDVIDGDDLIYVSLCRDLATCQTEPVDEQPAPAGGAALDPRTARETARTIEWNERYAIGTPVRYWTGVREGAGKTSRTRTEADLLGGHTAVVWVDNEPSCIALTHVQAGDTTSCPAAAQTLAGEQS